MTLKMKLIAPLFGVLVLGACGGAGNGGAVARELATGPSSCANMTGISRQYLTGTGNLPVRCGPQSVLPYTLR